MVKPIYCNLLLLVSCLIYEAHGNNHRVRHIKTPSSFISDNNDPYDSSSSSTAAADVAVEDTEILGSAVKLPSSRSLRKSFRSNDPLGYDRSRGLGSNNKPRRGIHYKQNPNMVSDDLNGGQMQNNMISGFSKDKSISGLDNRNDQTEMTLDDSNIKRRQNSMTSEGLNRRLLSGLNNRNKQNENTSKNKNLRKRQNSIISDFQDFPNSTQIKINPLARLIGKLRQNPLSPTLNEDDSQQISYGNENSSIMNMMNPNINSFNDRGQNISLSFRKCCINGDCRVLKDGEKCIEDSFTNMKDTQQPKNPMFVTTGNGDNGFQNMMSKLKPFNVNSFNRFGDNFYEDSNIQETGKPTNMQLDLMRYPTTIPFFDSSNGIGNGMGSFVNMPQKTKPKTYPHSEPIGLSEDEANEIRNRVLQKSNLYRKKYNLVPFTLDDQLNNCAQDWANNIAKLQTFQHRQNNAYGENLYADLDLNNLGEKAVDAWYNEITKFNIGDEESELGSNSGTHHMTQLLWKPSTKLGVGISQNPNGMYNVVANYDPRGNVLGYFKDNLPEIKQKDIKEAKESERAMESAPTTRWSSSSSFPFQSRWNNYEPY